MGIELKTKNNKKGILRIEQATITRKGCGGFKFGYSVVSEHNVNVDPKFEVFVTLTVIDNEGNVIERGNMILPYKDDNVNLLKYCYGMIKKNPKYSELRDC